jgi:hypothetical protein
LAAFLFSVSLCSSSGSLGDIRRDPPRLATAEKEIMATVSKLIFGVAIAAVSIATPALGQHER